MYGVSVMEEENINKVEISDYCFDEKENRYYVTVFRKFSKIEYQIIDRESEFRVNSFFDDPVVSRYIGQYKRKIVTLTRNDDGTIDPTRYPRRSAELIEVIDILAEMLPIYADVWELIKTNSKVDTVEEPHKRGDRFFTVKETPDINRLMEEVEALKKRVSELEEGNSQ